MLLHSDLIKFIPDLIIFYNSRASMKTELCLKVMLSEVHCDVSSTGPDLHVFYSDGKSEQTWTLSAGFLKPAF